MTTNFQIGDKIRIERRAIYANSHSSEREYVKEIINILTDDNTNAFALKFKGQENRWYRFNDYNNYLDSYFPTSIRFEYIEHASA